MVKKAHDHVAALRDAKANSLAYANDYLRRVPVAPQNIHLDEEAFAALMQSFLTALVSAYVAGFLAAKEEK